MHCGILLLLLVSVSTSSAKPFSRLIVHKGRDAPPGSHPWLLSFHKVNESTGKLNPVPWCGASLIRLPESDTASDIAVTAAHCIEKEKKCPAAKTGIFVNFGNENLTSDLSRMVEVATINCNPSWTGRKLSNNLPVAIGDIAVLKLARPIQLSDIVQGIDLPKKGEVVPRGTTCKVAGWGYTDYRGQKPARLQEANVTIADDAECAKKQAVIQEYEKESIICTFASANGGRHALSGDSGSALVCRDQANRPVLHGVVSGGYPDDSDEQNIHEVGFYSEVSFYVDWIAEAIKGMKGRI